MRILTSWQHWNKDLLQCKKCIEGYNLVTKPYNDPNGILVNRNKINDRKICMKKCHCENGIAVDNENCQQFFFFLDPHLNQCKQCNKNYDLTVRPFRELDKILKYDKNGVRERKVCEVGLHVNHREER